MSASSPLGPIPSTSKQPYRWAAQPEILRASQKDAYYVASLKDQVENAFRGLLGPRFLQRYASQVDLGTKLLYFSLTTYLGSQTLGEEYTSILQVSKGSKRVPSRQRRLVLMALHVIAPYALMGLYNRFKARYQAFKEVQSAETERKPWLQYLASFELPAFTSLVEEQLRPLNLAIFFLIGKYYSIAKRSLRIQYLSTQTLYENAPQPPSYEVLGVLVAVQLAAEAIHTAYKKRAAKVEAEQRATVQPESRLQPVVDGVVLSEKTFDPENPSEPLETDANEEGIGQEHRCTLCLGAKRDPTSTECGHVCAFGSLWILACFKHGPVCWECIVGWARERMECPLCRQNLTSLSSLLPLYNV